MLLSAASVPALEVSVLLAALTGLACVFGALYSTRCWDCASGCKSTRPDAGCWLRQPSVAKYLNWKHVLDSAGQVFFSQDLQPSHRTPK